MSDVVKNECKAALARFVCLWVGLYRPVPAGFCLGDARGSQCKSGPFLKKVACVDEYLFMAINNVFSCPSFWNLNFVVSFLKAMHLNRWNGKGYVLGTLFGLMSLQPASFGDHLEPMKTECGEVVLSTSSLKVGWKILGLPQRPRNTGFCCWPISLKQFRERERTLFWILQSSGLVSSFRLLIFPFLSSSDILGSKLETSLWNTWK